MGLICIAGSPYGYNMGNLKTYTCTLFGLLDHEDRRKIFSNYSLNIPHTYLESLEDTLEILEQYENITCLLDELSSWIDCYDRPSKNNGGQDLKNLAKQTRKVHNKIIYTSQCFNDIPNALRKLTSKVYITGKYHIINNVPIECVDDDCYINNYLGICECKIVGTELMQMSPIKYYPVNDDIFKIYDTNEIIYKKKCVKEPVKFGYQC
jgi:hypothetical protein